MKVYLGDIGWVMVRASGTEPMLRVYSETTRPETTRRVLDEVARFAGPSEFGIDCHAAILGIPYF